MSLQVEMIVMIRKIRRKRKDLSVGCLFVEQASYALIEGLEPESPKVSHLNEAGNKQHMKKTH